MHLTKIKVNTMVCAFNVNQDEYDGLCMTRRSR